MATVLTNAGEEWAVDKINETVQTEPEYIGWGEGAGTAVKADTDLFTPVNTDPGAVLRLVGTSSKTGTGATAKYQVIATLQSTNVNAKTNVGAWTAVSGGTLVIKADHTSTAMAIGDKIEYTITIDPA